MRKPSINLDEIFKPSPRAKAAPLDEIVEKRQTSRELSKYFLMFYLPTGEASIVYNVPEEYLQKSLGEFIDEVVKNTKSEKDYFWARKTSREFHEPDSLVEFNTFYKKILEKMTRESTESVYKMIFDGKEYYEKRTNIVGSDGTIAIKEEDVITVYDLNLGDVFSKESAGKVNIKEQNRSYAKGGCKVAIVTCERRWGGACDKTNV